MEEMGLEGWELVSAERVPVELQDLDEKKWGILCFFKREIGTS